MAQVDPSRFYGGDIDEEDFSTYDCHPGQHVQKAVNARRHDARVMERTFEQENFSEEVVRSYLAVCSPTKAAALFKRLRLSGQTDLADKLENERTNNG